MPMLVSDYDYELPEEAIAQEAIEPRDASRLLDTTTMTDRTFSDLPSMLRSGDLLVVNETKVRAARLIGTRETGGATEVLLTSRIDPERWQALIRPAKKARPGATIAVGEAIVVEVLTEPVDGIATVALRTHGNVEDAIASVGHIPLPPYFHGSLESDNRYQTVFARTVGSAAAPTAALHFTDELRGRLTDAGVVFATVDLQVGLDTFRPMDRGASNDAKVADHRIHTEAVVVPQTTVDAVAEARQRGGRVFAVGTTVVRSLESAARGHRGLITTFDGPTDLFITPGYRAQVIDGLITNFHAPGTTLLVMLASLAGEQWRVMYKHALSSGYRFLSFGDAMFLEVIR
jgi:S-adenosylmethionine:tRNA ribosyltransferase-isomerase